MTFQAFDTYVDTHAPAILDRLAAFCRIASISAENGPAMGQAADFVTRSPAVRRSSWARPAPARAA